MALEFIGMVVGATGREYKICHKPHNHESGVPAYYTCGCGQWVEQGWRQRGLLVPENCRHIKTLLAGLAEKRGHKVAEAAVLG
jgi:hypothetical protein